MNPRSTIFVLISFACSVIAPSIRAVTANGGSGGASSAVTLSIPLERPYAIVRPLAGNSEEPFLVIKKLTNSGRLLLGQQTSTLPPIQSGDILGYRWYQGVSEPITAPAAPWIYGSVTSLSYLNYYVSDMNDSGAVVGMSWARLFYYDSGLHKTVETGENLWIMWPYGTSASPMLINPGISDTITRLNTYSYMWMLYPMIDDSGFIRGIGSLSKFGTKTPGGGISYLDIADYDLFTTPDAATAVTQITQNVTGPYRQQKFSDVSPSGQTIISRQLDDGLHWESVADQTVFSISLVNNHWQGYTPSKIDDNGRYAGFDSTKGRLAWCSSSDLGLHYLEGLYPQHMNGYHDILGQGLTGVKKIWIWPRDSQSLQEYSDQLIFTIIPPTDSLGVFHLNDQGMLAGTLSTIRDTDGNMLPPNQRSSRPVLLVPAELAVDANHDGTITLSHENTVPTLSDATSATRPYRFWSNDDDDNPGSTAEADYLNSVVDGVDDLPDFFPVFLDIKQLLAVLPPSASVKYKLKQADGALNFIYTNLTKATAFDYQTGTLMTGFGPSFIQPAATATTQQITAAGVELPASFLTNIKDNDQGVILVELRGMTSAPLKLVVEKNSVPIAEVAVNIATGEIKWESLYANNPVEDFKIPAYYLDYTTKDLKWLEGKRYFSDGDGPTATFHRTRINVKVRMAGAAGKSVKLKAFDVDDQTPTEWDASPAVIDTNDTNGPAGNDNNLIGEEIPGLSGKFTTTVADTITTTLDSNGEAVVEFITTRKPGANYRIAAVLNDSASQVDALQVTNATAPRYIAPGARPVPGFAGVVSSTLTVWRRLHIEIDSMEKVPVISPNPELNSVSGVVNSYIENDPVEGHSTLVVDTIIASEERDRFANGKITIGSNVFSVTGNKYDALSSSIFFNGLITPNPTGTSFKLVDDDDFYLSEANLPPPLPKNGITTELLEALKPKYAPAFIDLVIEDSHDSNPDSVIPFRLNEPELGWSGWNSIFDDNKNIHDTLYYWAHTVAFAYQPDSSTDGDPSTGGNIDRGGTPDIGWTQIDTFIGVSVIYMESNREATFGENLSAQFLSNQETMKYYKRTYWMNLFGTIAHEIGHAPGRETPGHDHSEQGLMADGGSTITTDFSSATIRRFRSVSKWGTINE
jgi:hypothetical protein